MYLKSCTNHFKWVPFSDITQRFLMLKRAVLKVTVVLHVVRFLCQVYECYEVSPYERNSPLITSAFD